MNRVDIPVSVHRFTLLNRVPFGKFNKVNPEPVDAYRFFNRKKNFMIFNFYYSAV